MSDTKNMTVLGGHAIMLGVELPKELNDLADAWVAEKPDVRKRKKPHVTLVWVGKDLPLSHGIMMRATSQHLVDESPSMLRTKGPIVMFGGKKDHMVALVETMVSADLFRKKIIAELDRSGVKLEKTWAWNPHVTLAVGAPNDELPATRLRAYPLPVTSIEVKTGDNIYSYPVRVS